MISICSSSQSLVEKYDTIRQFKAGVERLVRLFAYSGASKEFPDRLMVQVFSDGGHDINIQHDFRKRNPRKIEVPSNCAMELVVTR